MRTLLCSLVLAGLAAGSLVSQRKAEKAPAATPPAAARDTMLYRSLKFRAVGPAVMGGRMSAFAVRPGNAAVIFAATGTGGLFKTTNLGTTWQAVFEHEGAGGQP